MISADNKIFLDEIANRLFTNHAAVMVGAGFSKNAISNGTSCKKFPDWNELGNLFYDKLYEKESNPPDKYYLNVLKLAEEVQAAFGRHALDDMLQQNIPDAEYEPSELHKNLLELPWIDVFTTNYDTLLERAAKNVFNRKYTVVYSKDDLVHAIKPRIIKLHGSFIPHQPFTITEEDYRIYPKINAPFVNTVQQSLLENTLCLIGFSGDDPNFLQWLGWFRDNLEKNTTKIYLIGSFNLSSSQKKLLDKRNIVLVNLAKNHHDALNIFVSYLSEKRRTNNILLWPYNNANDFIPKTNAIEKSIVDTIAIWETERKTYPGWVVLPEGKRKSFWLVTQNWFSALIGRDDLVNTDVGFKFVFELCWRLDKSLHPMNKQTASLVIKAIGDSFDCEDKIILGIYLLKFYRQNGKTNEWKNLYSVLNSLKKISPKLKGDLDYENALFALFYLDYPKLKKIVQEWLFLNSTPFENAKKAGILAEIGNLKKAIEIVKESLIIIREQEKSMASSTDCSLLSQESYILDLYQSLLFASRNVDDSRIQKKEYLDRLSTLKKYLCDPIHECDYFRILLSSEYKQQKNIDIHSKYDIGEATITDHSRPSFHEQENAFAFLLYCENTGIPFCIHHKCGIYGFLEKEARSSIARISDYNLIWAISICCRIADEKAADTLFTRKAINNLSTDSINHLCEGLVSTLSENENEISIDETEENNFAQVLAKIIPEIISRLVTKCNTETKFKILKLINSILLSQSRDRYFGFEKLIKRFAKSLLPAEIELFFLDILRLPIPRNITYLDDRLLAPLEYLKADKIFFSSALKFDKKLLDPYYGALASSWIPIRKWGFITLARLYELNILDNREQQRFADLLWKEIDNDGLPYIPDYSKAFFTKLPHPARKDCVKLLKRHIILFQFENFSLSSIHRFPTQDISQTTSFFLCINYLANSDFLDKKEAGYLIQKIYRFWTSNKDILNNKKFENDYIPCFYQMQWALGNLLKIVNIACDSVELNSLLKDLEHFGLSSFYIRSVISSPQKRKELQTDLEINIANKDSNKRIDALYGIYELFVSIQSKDDTKLIFKALLFSILYDENILIYHNIDFLVNFIEKNNAIAKEFKTLIMNVLNHLASITDYANEDSVLSFDEKLIIRQRAIHLAFIMKRDVGCSAENEVLMWEKISNDDNEFSDIRNKWM